MGILAKKLPDWTAELLIEHFLCNDDYKLIYASTSTTFPRVKNAMEVLKTKELVRITAQNDKFTVYEYLGPERKTQTTL